MSIDIFQSKELKKNKKIKTDPTSEIIRNSLNSAAEQMKRLW